MGFILLLFDISGGELILIILAILILFGPSKLPGIIRQYKSGMQKLNSMKDDISSTLENEQNQSIEKETEDKFCDMIDNYKSSQVEHQKPEGNNSEFK